MNSHLVNTHLFPGESIVTSSCDEAIVISYSLSVLRAHGISIFIVFAIWHSIKVCRNACIFSLIYLCVCIFCEVSYIFQSLPYKVPIIYIMFTKNGGG